MKIVAPGFSPNLTLLAVVDIWGANQPIKDLSSSLSIPSIEQVRWTSPALKMSSFVWKAEPQRRQRSCNIRLPFFKDLRVLSCRRLACFLWHCAVRTEKTFQVSLESCNFLNQTGHCVDSAPSRRHYWEPWMTKALQDPERQSEETQLWLNPNS